LRFHPPDQLPVEVGKLRFLQTLDLTGTRVKELPSIVIRGLGQLMCLRGSWIGEGNTRLPYGLKKLTSLAVLEDVVVTSGRIAEQLGHLTELRVLKLSTEEADKDEWTACSESLLESLGKLTK
jgi:disease resistance protein RPM1